MMFFTVGYVYLSTKVKLRIKNATKDFEPKVGGEKIERGPYYGNILAPLTKLKRRITIVPCLLES